MAKRYFKYDDLLTVSTGYINHNGDSGHKPEGTMGTHHFTLAYTNVGDETHIIVEGYDSSNKRTNKTTIRPGDTLGYNCGKTWRIPAPRSSWERYKQKYRVSVKYVPRNNWKIKRDIPYRTLSIYDDSVKMWRYISKDEGIPDDAFMLMVNDMWRTDLYVRRSERLYIDPLYKKEAIDILVHIHDEFEDKFTALSFYLKDRIEQYNASTTH